MKLATRFAAARLVLGLALVTACSKGGSSNPAAPPGGTLELNSGNIGVGGTFPHPFANAGSFPYRCSIHSGMTGTVTVSASSGVMSASVSIVNSTSSGFSPASVTIGVGGTVTWTNNDNVTHTVTSN